MSWFKKKPTEIQLELIAMHAACIAKAKESDTGQLTSDDDIKGFLDISCKGQNVKPDKDQMRLAMPSVQALLVEGDFINELLEFRSSNPKEPLPPEFRGKMLSAVEKSVNEFMSNSKE